ncbi:hypothetical protein Q7C36_014125 [Tachysurus vachellii]|uniref:Ig-like domain-containing protein n=1 Tax=Tachysurus vachellii TaxID=175792 RepID=A0AA88MFT3_TACVA|nr:hypothetical protein Q7C36_014125 [Tachysurus vachellii]
MDWGTDLWIFKFNWTLLYLTQLPGMVILALQNGDGCPITIQPAKLVVEFGASATANCSTTVTHNGMGWEAVTGAVDKTKGVQFLIWRVESLKYWETQPICYINAHEQCESKLPVTLYKRPEKVSISTVDHTGPMIEGKQYKLDCDVQNVAPVNLLTVNWYKGQPGQLVKSVQFNNTSSKTPVNRSTELSISTSKEDDGVQYRCEAKLELGPEGPQPPPIKTSDPLNIIVHYKPIITCSDWSALFNTPLSSYPYNVMGKPSPNITCYRDQSPVSSDMRLSKSDTGQYRFTASNEVGSSSCDTKITVEYPPTFNCPKNYTGKENESFLDKCSVMASPVANITWTKDGKTVSPLHSLTRGDSGSYVITAVNKHGVEPHRMIVNVQYGPEIQPVTRSEVVKAGNDLSLSCTAEGNPEPEVSWSFQNQTKATGRRQTILNLSKANSADAGEYLCTASNELGSKTRTVSLTVEGTVSISTVDHTGPMIEGKQYKLDCDVQNVAPVNLLTVNWYKGQPGQLVKSVQFNNISSKTPVNRSTELSISTSKEDDGVQYRCEAKLELGPEGPQPPPIKTSDPLSIIVHYGPEIQPVTRSEVVKAGNDLSLSCTAEGNPEPEVSWSFQNQTKATGRRQTILNLSKANSADAGEYLCTASNELGSKTRTVSLTVEESNTRTIIICVGVLLLILIIAYGIYIFVRRR